MFARPKTMTFVAAAEKIDIGQRYLVKLVEIKDEGVSSFADPADAEPAHNLRWIFRMAKMDRTPILDIDGAAYEHHDYTSNKTGKSKSRTANARLWAEALMGRPLEDDEIDDSLPNTLREKVAVALFEEKERGGQDGGESYLKLKILRLSPYKGGGAGAAELKSVPAQVVNAATAKSAPRREPVAAAAAAPASASDDELPF